MKVMSSRLRIAARPLFRERHLLFQLFEPVEDDLDPWGDAGRAFPEGTTATNRCPLGITS